MKNYLFLLFLCFSPFFFAQKVYKEQLSKEVKFFYDFIKTKIESRGCYYQDPLGETMEKHGLWRYFDKEGTLVEERNYYRGKLHGATKLYFSNKKLKQEGYFIQDKQDSIYREWAETGKLLIEGNYTKGSPIKTWDYFYLSGKQKSHELYEGGEVLLLSFWVDDSLHTQYIKEGNGYFYEFYQTGATQSSYQYLDGRKQGVFQELSIYGYPLIIGKFEKGEKDSTWNYYDYNGDIEKICTYKREVLDGEYTLYFSKNRLNIHGFYENAKKTGEWTWYNNQGGKDQEGFFKEDKQDGKWVYYFPDGKVSYRAEYDMDKKIGVWTYWYQTGEMFKQGSFKNDLKDGEWKTWYEDGTVLMQGTYLEGKEEGKWLNYWENGILKNEATFSKGFLNGKWLSNFPSGKSKLLGEYKDGMKTGEWIDFYENGKPKDVGSYKIVKKKSKIDFGPLNDFESLESVKDGKWVSYSNKDFKKIEEGEYSNGNKDGLWIAYHQGGKMPCVTSDYKNGLLDGKLSEYDRKGNLISDTEFKNGLKHGWFRVYDKKGKVVKEKEFEKGLVKNMQGTFGPPK